MPGKRRRNGEDTTSANADGAWRSAVTLADVRRKLQASSFACQLKIARRKNWSSHVKALAGARADRSDARQEHAMCAPSPKSASDCLHPTFRSLAEGEVTLFIRRSEQV
jgi:hypothetical protein